MFHAAYATSNNRFGLLCIPSVPARRTYELRFIFNILSNSMVHRRKSD